MSAASLPQYTYARAETPTTNRAAVPVEVEEDAQPPEKSCIHSPTRWFQFFMFVAFVITLACALSMNNQNLSPGILWGSGLSFFAVIFVILSYSSEPKHRRHPNPLIFWRTIADFIFVCRLIAEQFIRCVFFDCKQICNANSLKCVCDSRSSASSVCTVLAGILEFSLIASELWFVCMSANLYFSLTNPFTDFKRNTKVFHLICWGSGAFLAILLMGIKDLAGKSDLGICWTNADRSRVTDYVSMTEMCNSPSVNQTPKVLDANYPSWFFFYIWMVMFIIYGLGVWLWAWKRLSEGTPETYAVRVQSINRARFYVFSVTLYWVTVVIIYIAYLSTNAAERNEQRLLDKQSRYWLYELMNFILSSKGYLDFVVWFALNDFEIPKIKNICRKDIIHVDVDLSPQVNAALRREVLFYTTSGIIQAVHAAERLPESQKIQHLALLPQVKDADIQHAHATSYDATLTTRRNPQRTKTFHDYEPHAFRRIRERFGVDNERYLKSLSTTAKERLSEGASGAFMFFSGDGSLIVKSTSKEECRFLRSIADDYANYLCESPHSLLTRFYGCHCLELYGQKFSFVVMANLFDTDQVIHSRYDIKGSWVNRNADLPKRGKKVTCRHCNRKYIYQSNQANDVNCPQRLVGHEPNVVLKDNDLTQKLRLDQDSAIELYRQLEADADMLWRNGIMDYSLLLGIHDVEYVVDGDEMKDDVSEGISPTGEESSPVSAAMYNPFSDKSVMDPNVYTPNLPHQIQMPKAAQAGGVAEATPVIPAQRKRPKSNSSQRKAPRGGMRMANTVVGPAYYHIGIIDILQTWTLNKQLERLLKIHIKRLDGEGLSAIHPKEYKGRFLRKMADILGVQHLLDSEQQISDNIYIPQNTHMDLEPAAPAQGLQSLRPLSSGGAIRSSREANFSAI